MITPPTLEQRIQAKLNVVLPILQGLLASGNYTCNGDYLEDDSSPPRCLAINHAAIIADDLMDELEKDAAEEIEEEAKAELADQRTAEAEDDRIAEAMKKQIGQS